MTTPYAPRAASPEAFSIAVVMPALDAASVLPQSMPPLTEMLRQGVIQELIVVDDGSADATKDVARAMGGRVIDSGGRRRGPGAARNVAAQIAASDLLWFVDSDVVAHPDSPRWIRYTFEESDVVAMFGSYDDRPAAPSLLSQYKNLAHHHYHQTGRREAATFWAGCGAVRRAAFLSVGGFDARRYPKPSIEDIELGYRLRAAGGRIILCRELQATHLKAWRMRNLVATDVRQRALPWARLLLSGAGPRQDLNVGMTEQIRAFIACLLPLSLVAAIPGLLPWSVFAATVALSLVANLDLLSRLCQRIGLGAGLAALLFHQCYYIYSTAAYIWCWLETKSGLRRKGRMMRKP